MPSALKVAHPNPHPLLHGAAKAASGGDDDGSVGADAALHNGGGGGGSGGNEGVGGASEADTEEARTREGSAWAEAEAWGRP